MSKYQPPLSNTPLYIGTSGIVLPGSKETFPEEFKQKTRLQYYSSIFNSVEINSSFYKTPLAKTFGKWRDEVASFTFTIKLSKAITHAKQLSFDPEEVTRFLNAADFLGDKKGALLIQFPASVGIEYARKVEEILLLVVSSPYRSKWQVAIEVRNPSFYCKPFYCMLNHYEASLVFHDMPGSVTPLHQTANDIIYLRLHGPTGNYKGSYSVEKIQQYTEWLMPWCEAGKTIFVYFNNTIGNAFHDALALKACLSKHE